MRSNTVMTKRNRTEIKRQLARLLTATLVTVLLIVLFSVTVWAAPVVTFDLGSGETGGQFGLMDALFLVTILALAPSILIMMTSFTRIIIVLSFVRTAMGTQQSPPNQVLIGLSLFLTLFVMYPTLNQVNEQAYQPYRAGLIEQKEAVSRAVVPMKEFMLRQIYTEDLNLFLAISNESQGIEITEVPEDAQLMDLGLQIVVPAFVTSELKRAFTIGFLLYIPFLIIDMVVSSTLMSMGMVMLPPTMIALPFKIMMFVLVDGWGLLLGSLARSFR